MTTVRMSVPKRFRLTSTEFDLTRADSDLADHGLNHGWKSKFSVRSLWQHFQCYRQGARAARRTLWPRKGRQTLGEVEDEVHDAAPVCQKSLRMSGIKHHLRMRWTEHRQRAVWIFLMLRGRSEACQTHDRGRNCPDTPCCVPAGFSPYEDSKDAQGTWMGGGLHRFEDIPPIPISNVQDFAGWMSQRNCELPMQSSSGIQFSWRRLEVSCTAFFHWTQSPRHDPPTRCFCKEYTSYYRKLATKTL